MTVSIPPQFDGRDPSPPTRETHEPVPPPFKLEPAVAREIPSNRAAGISRRVIRARRAPPIPRIAPPTRVTATAGSCDAPPLEPPIAAPVMVVPLPTAQVATVSVPGVPPSAAPAEAPNPPPSGSRAGPPDRPPVATRSSTPNPSSRPIASPPIAIPPAPVGADVLPGEEPRRWRDFFHAQASAWISLCVHAVALIALSLVMIGEKVREQFVVVAGVADGPDALESIIDLPLTDLTLEMPDAPNLAETLALNPVTMQTLTDDAGGAPGELADVVTGGLDDQITETVARLTGGGGEGDGAGTGQGDGLGGLGLDGDFKKMIENAQQNGLDLVIVFDSTGSMGAEIEGVKRQIFQIGSALLNKVPTTRISLVTYRDKGPGEQFDVQGLELTSSVSKLTQFMTPVQANGGGDHEEGVELGLHWATTYNKFRPKARKVILIFGDAPPHSRDLAACERMAAEFHRYQSGIVTTVTIRGLRPMPEFAAIAKAGGGEAYTNQQPERLMSELLVLTFGAKHRQDVAKFFNLAPAGGRPPTRPTRPASPARGPSRGRT